MRNTVRLTPMRGFSAAIGRADALASTIGAAAIAVGRDDEGEDVRVLFSLRHADGTTLTASLSAEGLDRFAHLVADVLGVVPDIEVGTVQ